MAGGQAITNDAVAKAVAEATTAAIQAMAAATTESPQNTVGPKVGGSATKQPSFNWEANDKYSELKKLQVRSV